MAPKTILQLQVFFAVSVVPESEKADWKYKVKSKSVCHAKNPPKTFLSLEKCLNVRNFFVLGCNLKLSRVKETRVLTLLFLHAQ